jgi:hypothetical protein
VVRKRLDWLSIEGHEVKSDQQLRTAKCRHFIGAAELHRPGFCQRLDVEAGMRPRRNSDFVSPPGSRGSFTYTPAFVPIVTRA